MPDTGFPRRVTDFRGRTLLLRQPPRRIVSLTPGTTETLFAIGAGRQVVGVTAYCDYPPEAKRLPKVGDMRTDVEAVVALRPDLVVADGVLNRRFIPQLERLKLPLLVIAPKSWLDVAKVIRLLGKATGHDRTAETLASRFEQEERKLRSRPANPHPVSVLFTLNVEPLPMWVAGRDLFVNDMIRLAGGRNVAEDGGTNYYAISTEVLLTKDPDVIITTVPADRLSPLREHPVLRRLKAVRNGAVYSVDSNLFVRPTPRLLKGLEVLRKILAEAKRR
ncbi:MAG: cobalamin-binding protein [Chthonomonadetes bacterium]|nr:cobalamin-binding protein [Chthonomonadetes bacterium]